jgi:zinc and cadmium transporter
MQVAMSFVGGAMLGVALLHLIPHAYFEAESIYLVAGWLLGGFLAMFFIERMFQFHQHPEEEHAEEEHAGHPAHRRAASAMGWAAVLVGLVLHSMLDGVALAASIAAEGADAAAEESSAAGASAADGSGHADVHRGGILPGLAVFLVVLLHKPFDSLTLGTLMAVGGQSIRRRQAVNALFALAVPLGVVLFQLAAPRRDSGHTELVGCALALTAGAFLCISTSDLLPELHFHSHDRVKLSLALVAGLGLAALLVVLESSGHPH